MATPQGIVTFADGEATRSLVFDINALCALEDEFGVSIAEIGGLLSPVVKKDDGSVVQSSVKISNVRQIFRTGLVAGWADGEPTIQDAGDIMGRIGLADAARLVGEAFQAAFPDAVVTDDKSGNVRKR